MIQEFITAKGKIIKERDVLFIKNLNWKFHDSLVYELLISVLFLIVAVWRFMDIERDWDLFRACLFSIIALSFAYPLYDVVFRRSLSKRIPLQKIKSFEIKDGESQLEKAVILHLKSGRYKKILFRKLENQYEPFTELVSQHIVQTQLA